MTLLRLVLLHVLRYMSFYNQFLSGSLPDSMSMLTALSHLGTWPSLCDCSVLAAFHAHVVCCWFADLYYNILSGTLPSGFGSMTALM